MIYDPFFLIFTKINVSYVVTAIIYAFSFIISMSLMLYISGGVKSVKEYLKDPLGVFFWPFFVLAPVFISYFSISELGELISNELNILNLKYEHYSLGLEKSKYIFWLLVTLGFVESIESLVRYKKSRPDLWLSKPKFLQPISTILYNFPLGTMTLIIFVRIIDQWISLHRFMNSGWTASTVYSSDGMYGLRWLYSILLSQMIIAIIASFSSLLILLREGKQKYSWIYKTIFTITIASTGIALYNLITELNSLFTSINAHYLEQYFSELNQIQLLSNNLSLKEISRKMLVLQEITMISNLPQKIPIPAWVSGILGIRLIVFIPEVYALLAKSFGWKKLPLNFKKVIDFIK